MATMAYVGLDVHKKTVAYCVKTASGRVRAQGVVAATRRDLTRWARELRGPWTGAMEATLFTGWIYDHLREHARELKVAHPLRLRAIATAKKKTDAIDAATLADLLRCGLLPECYMAPPEVRELRRVLRYRNLLVGEAVRMKNKTSGLLMEVGAQYDSRRLHGRKYFAELLATVEDVPRSVIEMLEMSRGALELFRSLEKRLVRALRQHESLRERLEGLMTIPGVGEITALTWALEVGEVERFASVGKALSYCGLTSAHRESAGKVQRGPISKQRNAHLQTVLIEAAKLAPRWSPRLASVHARELERGNRNRATLAVARKLVAYLMYVDKTGRPFVEPQV